MNANEARIEELIALAIRRIIRSSELRSRHLRDECGLTTPQLAALQLADRMADASASALSRELHLSRSSLTGILDRLEERKLIHRVPNARDRRGLLVETTSAGRALAARAPALIHDAFIERLSKLPEWERTSILSSLQRLAAMMEEDPLDDGPGIGN